MVIGNGGGLLGGGLLRRSSWEGASLVMFDVVDVASCRRRQ